MKTRSQRTLLFITLAALSAARPTFAQDFFFSTGDSDGKIATATRPSSGGKIEIEAADDFVLTNTLTQLDSATFTGLIPLGANLSDIGNVRVEIYRVFPKDSDVGRTSGPPDFSTDRVPTRVNSPSDVAFAERDVATSSLTFKANILQSSFTANNSVLNGIHPLPGVFTGGEGPVTGQEIQFSVDFTKPFDLPADHYFFVPQVELANGDFLWLSAPKPIVAPGTPFLPDLQSWIRNEDLAPDWLRIGTDITHQGPFNAAFSLAGEAVVPEPGALSLLAGVASVGLVWRRRRVRR